jgi:SAM-dependent methyltransferase
LSSWNFPGDRPNIYLILHLTYGILVSNDTPEAHVADLPALVRDDGSLDWEALFQIYEFDQYRAYADELTRNEVDFIEMALDLREDAALLDVACGGGRHALELARRGYSVEGVDDSATLVAYATCARSTTSSSSTLRC